MIARASIADAIDTILYSPAEPTVGRHCRWCPVSRWCRAYGSQAPADVDGPVGDLGGEPVRMSLLAYAEMVTVDVEADIPF